MKSSRGRINLYKILFADEKLRENLVKTELLSKQSLTTLLNENEPIIVKPVYGSEEIYIFQKSNQYLIKINNRISTYSNIEALYSALKNETTQQYYIIQKSPTCHRRLRQFVTMHRSSSEWYLVAQTENIRSSLDTSISPLNFEKIQKVAMRAATLLGESFPNYHTIVFDIACGLNGDIWIYDSNIHLPNSKWSQYHELRRDCELHQHLPDTALLTPVTFHQYLDYYQSIILKPCIGQNGDGVISIRTKNDSTYEIHTGIKKVIKPNVNKAFNYIQKNLLDEEEYIVQQKIALATINNNPMDIRVVMQKTNNVWKITGKIVKVAGENFIITNAAQKLLTIEKAVIDAKITKVPIQRLEDELNRICFIAVAMLEEDNEYK